MNEQVNTQTGEVIEVPIEVPVALAKTGGMRDIVKAQDLPLLDVMETMDTLDWRNLKPHQTALLLMCKPMMSGGGQLFLSFRQAILFATRAYELGVSPFSAEVWFDPSKGSTQLTLEGKKTVARNRGLDLGPPQFENMERPWEQVPKLGEAAKEAQKAGFTKDIGVRCTIRVGPISNKEYASYDCWLSDWYVSRSPVWKERATWMLSVRSQDKCISIAMGTGVSEPLSDD